MKDYKDIFVTGIGVISAIGNNVSQNLDNLRVCKGGIGDISILQTEHKSKFKLGEIKLTNEELLSVLGLSEGDLRYYSRTSLLGMIAAREALNYSGVNLNDGLKTGVVSATTVGGMDKTEMQYAKKNVASGFIATHPCGDSTEKIAQFLKISSYCTTISTACSSAANALIHASRLIRHGIIDRAIVGGTDALSIFTLNGFNSLMILDKNFCKPFDKNRQGLNLGEGAGFLVIESEKSLRSGQHNAICKLNGYANANDAYHQTASSPEGEGAFRSMDAAIKMANLMPEDISYINAHGTGTPNNDLTESIAIQRLFGNQTPPFSSTKAYTGHTLAASAGIESVFSVLSIMHGLIFPNLNFKEGIAEVDIRPQISLIEGSDICHVLSNSFGFGGNNSSLVFSKL